MTSKFLHSKVTGLGKIQCGHSLKIWIYRLHFLSWEMYSQAESTWFDHFIHGEIILYVVLAVFLVQTCHWFPEMRQGKRNCLRGLEPGQIDHVRTAYSVAILGYSWTNNHLLRCANFWHDCNQSHEDRRLLSQTMHKAIYKWCITENSWWCDQRKKIYKWHTFLPSTRISRT